VEEKNTSILDLPADYTLMAISSRLTLKEVSQLARISTRATTFFADALTNAKVITLLQHVAFGEQDEAERILKEDPTLLLRTGQITDHSGRTFQDITAFQYALWALDRHMWTMILKYLPKEEAARQLHDHIYHEKAYKEIHGDYYDFVPLIDALQTYVNNYANQTRDQNRKHWQEIVRGAKLLVPAHVANEYCQQPQHFYPLPNFKEDTLQRVLSVYDFANNRKSTWFHPSCADGRNWRHGGVDMDLETINALCKVRNGELVELKQQLLPNPAQAHEMLNPVAEKQSCVIS
jgi:hypothetical protein